MSADPNPRRRRGSLRLRITLAATAAFAAIAIVAAVLLVVGVRARLVDNIRSIGEAQLDKLEAQVREGVPVDQLQAPTPPPGGGPALEVRPPGGTPRSLPLPEGSTPPTTRAGAQIGNSRTVLGREGEITLIAASSLDEVNETVDTLRDALLLAVPVLIAMVALASWFVTGRSLRPVEAIRTEVEEITHTSLHRRVPLPDSDDEIARLAGTMNEMLDRLEDAQRRQRAFVSDASHELRSPVAALRATLEVALRHPDRSNWTEIARRALRENTRLERAVEDLLQLAALDEGAQLRREPVDLDDLVLEEASHLSGPQVDTSKVSAGRVLGERSQMARVVRNLLDNAARHAMSTVAVVLQPNGSGIVLTVDDDGPGIPMADRERVFERFTRLDEARGRDAGGAGLGLAMAKAIVERHGGTVAVGDAPLGGARFTVTLPSES